MDTMKSVVLFSFLSIALWSNAQVDKSDEPYFRLGFLSNYYFCKNREEDVSTYSDGSTSTQRDTTDLTNGGLGFYSTVGYAFGNGMRVGVDGKAYLYRDKSYTIGIFGMVGLGPVLEYEVSEEFTLYTKLNWNFDYAYKDDANRRAYSIGAGGYIAIPQYPFALVRLNLEYMVSGGTRITEYETDGGTGVQLTRLEATDRYRGLVAELGISVGF
ncbi:MAG: hypothetical protein NXI10_01070 [bacterium]|nr:hypothetical protein [bacterium]